MATRPDILWLDGEVKINGSDAATIESVDGPVELDITPQEVTAFGQRAIATHTDQVQTDVKMTITGIFWDFKILQYLQGLVKRMGTLADGLASSANYGMTGEAASQARPYFELLVTGKKKGTENPDNGNLPYRVEIWGGRVMLSGALQIIEQKNDYTKAKLTFKFHALEDKSAYFMDIRDEEQKS